MKKIVIAAPIYPPEIGGPAQYAFHLEQEFRRLGHQVRVVKFVAVRHWPTGLRHLIYFFKLLPAMVWADWAVALDTFSVALPAVVAAKLAGTKIIIRTGGDFLWEWYVERTGYEVMLSSFYKNSRLTWNGREKIIFFLTRWLLNSTHRIVFSSDWQRDLWHVPYTLNLAKTKVVENYYGPIVMTKIPVHKKFLWVGRNITLKNVPRLKRAFVLAQKTDPELTLLAETVSPEKLPQLLMECYAVILPSFSEVSPNTVLEALSYGKPCIVTQDNGLSDRFSNLLLTADPFNEIDMVKKILTLTDPVVYGQYRARIAGFNFCHDWSEIARDFIALI